MNNSTNGSSAAPDVDEPCCVRGLTSALLTINIINSILHGFGTYILLKIVRQVDSKPQHIYLLGLSFSEFFMNFLDMVRHIVKISRSKDVDDDVKLFTDILEIINFSGTWFVVYFMMVYITLDRLLLVILNVKHHDIITRRRAIIVFSITWTIGEFFCNS